MATRLRSEVIDSITYEIVSWAVATKEFKRLFINDLIRD